MDSELLMTSEEERRKTLAKANEVIAAHPNNDVFRAIIEEQVAIHEEMQGKIIEDYKNGENNG